MNIYYRSFLENELSSGRSWEEGTLYFYIFLLCFISLLGLIIEKTRKNNGKLPKSRLIFSIITLLLVIVLGFRDITVGTDTYGYNELFHKIGNPKLIEDELLEPGFLLLMKLFHYLFPSSEWAIILISSSTVCLFLAGIWRYRNTINLFVALSLYVGLYYFQAMNLTRMYFAIAIMFYFFHYIVEGNYKKYLFVILICSLIHYSSLVMLFPIAFLFLYKKSSKWALIGIGVSALLIIPLSNIIADYLAIARYAAYVNQRENVEGGIGLMLFFDYMPCLAILFYAINNKLKGEWFDLLVCFTAIGFFFRIFGYYFPGGGRLQVHFIPLFVLLSSYFVNHAKLFNKFSYRIMLVVISVFLIVKVHVYFMGYLASDGIMPYRFLWSN